MQRGLLVLILILAFGAGLFFLFDGGGSGNGQSDPDVESNGTQGAAPNEGADSGLDSASAGDLGANTGDGERSSADKIAERGLVVDAAGQPVAEAQVWLGDEHRSTRSSGDDGSFAIPAWVQKRQGAVHVGVAAEGYLPKEVDLFPTDPWRITLDVGGQLDIQLVDRAGDPIHAHMDLNLRCGNVRREFKTNGHGFVSTSGWQYQPVEIAWDEQHSVLSDPLTPDGPVVMNLVLPHLQQHMIRGIVLGNGQPIANARVHRLGELTETEPVLTNEEGRFEMPSSNRIRETVLVAETEDFAPTGVQVMELHHQGEEITIELHPGRVLPGRVLTKEGNAPVVGAEVLITMHVELTNRPTAPNGLHPVRTFGRSVESDEEGNFQSGQLPARTDVTFQAVFDERYSDEAKREAGNGEEVVLWIPIPIRLVGRVLDPQGQPIPDARVGLRRKYKPNRVGYGRNKYTVDSEGRFDISATKDWERRFHLVASAPGCLPNGVRIRKPTAGVPVEVDIVLEPNSAGRITGRVKDAQGTPINDVRVRVQQQGDVVWGTRTDPFGRFRLRSLPRGEYAVYVDKPPEGLLEGEVVVRTDTDDLTLTLAAARHIVGTLLAPAGSEVSGFDAEIMLKWGEEQRWTFCHAEEGIFRLDAPPPGTMYTVTVVPRSMAPILAGPYTMPDSGANHEITIQLQPGWELKGFARLPDDYEGEISSIDATLYWLSGDGTKREDYWLTTNFDISGRFGCETVPGPCDLRYLVRARTRDGGFWEASGNVQATHDGQNLDVELVKQGGPEED